MIHSCFWSTWLWNTLCYSSEHRIIVNETRMKQEWNYSFKSVTPCGARFMTLLLSSSPHLNEKEFFLYNFFYEALLPLVSSLFFITSLSIFCSNSVLLANLTLWVYSFLNYVKNRKVKRPYVAVLGRSRGVSILGRFSVSIVLMMNIFIQSTPSVIRN